YVNGVEICRNEIGNEYAFYGNSGLTRATIGTRHNYGQTSNAIIDDIHLYNRALTPAEVDALFKGPIEQTLSADLSFSTTTPCGNESLAVTAILDNPQLKNYEWSID